MEENKSHDKGYCVGPICYHGDHGKNVMIRWFLGVAILVVVFWLGMKVGEFKTMFGGYGYGYGMHSGYSRSMPMMQGFYGQDRESPYRLQTR